ncbi:DUF4194 domain-containing protein [Gimesia algae]|uniref:DUF4194 domain-containing protein n=1 Tax=Gimesia algae TaxID=2527971 RepID=A0A517V732_9PLAN|nr:DUF4194 domain-containing protein [Gimesia algae]QDT88803.1 hypothetical protein Pan161_04220 [Gimesia algae]
MSETDELEITQSTSVFEFPKREPWSSAAIKLLKGIVYHDDKGNTWDEILANVSPLTDLFGRLGVVLIINEEDGMAWLHQPEDDELPSDYETIPKLFHKKTLGFEGTLLCVVLRDELRRSEEEDLQNDRCVVKQSELFMTWQMFFPENSDEVRLNDALSTHLIRLEKMKYVRRFEKNPPSWEIRRILKARLPLEALKTIRNELEVEMAKRRRGGA